MNDQEKSDPAAGRSAAFAPMALAGTALALLLGGGAHRRASLESSAQTTPALADAVQVQGVEPVSFADVVDKVRPAVVSVRVKSAARGRLRPTAKDTPFFDFPPGSPMEQLLQAVPSAESERPAPAGPLADEPRLGLLHFR